MSVAGNPPWNVNILETFLDDRLLKRYRWVIMIVVELSGMDSYSITYRNNPVTLEIKGDNSMLLGHRENSAMQYRQTWYSSAIRQ